VDPDDIHINMVFVKINKPIDPVTLTEALKNDGILVNPPVNGEMRFVTHYYIGRQQIEKTVGSMKKILSS
jgi:threonine aldolase